MSGNPFNLRVARPTDAEGITAVLTSAYTSLMAPFYDPAVMAVALPSMTIANPVLLESQTYYVQDYVQETPEARIVSCGGWTQTEPGTNKVENGVAHIRHFGTHVDWTRRGLGAGIFERCRHDALAVGVHTFWCFSSLGAESFYASLGFSEVERMDVVIGGSLRVPTIKMIWEFR